MGVGGDVGVVGLGGSGVSAFGAIPPAGFPGCGNCAYLDRADVSTCLACCTTRFPAAGAAPAAKCAVCDQALRPNESCANDWCTRADRWFSVVWSIGPHVGAWRRVIAGHKYQGQTGWATVLGRVLLGYLDEHMPWFDEFDVLVPMPAYTGAGARRSRDQVGEIVAVASRLAGPCWRVESGLVVKTKETPALAGLSRPARRACAEGSLRAALRVPEPAAVAGRRILVIDDVFTEGSTLREAARALVRAGADEVAGLTLARQPWQRGPSSPQP
jgi:predicted amidophosphoribosyltransferase